MFISRRWAYRMRNEEHRFLMKKTDKNKTAVQKLPPVLERVTAAAMVAEENRSTDVIVLDIQELTKTFDYFVIATGTSRKQLQAVADEIQKKLCREMGDERLGTCGYSEAKWIVLDYGDIVVHLFEPETRKYYALEELWGKGKNIDWKKYIEEHK